MNSVKRIISLFLCLIMVFSLVGCGAYGDNSVTSDTAADGTYPDTTEGTALSSDPESTQKESTAAEGSQLQTTTEKNTTEKHTSEESTTAERTTEKETDKTTQEKPARKSLKILSVGNSLSRDGMHYLPQLLEEAGYTDIVIAYLYVGGCSLEEHVENVKCNRKAYDYFENTGSGWGCKEGVSLKYGLGAHKWDYVVLQQASRLSGISSSYKYLDELISVVRNNTRSNPQLLWHMTWAYEDGSDLDLFEKYDYDRHKMYRQTVSCIKEHILTNRNIRGVIPVGSAVENYRNTSSGSPVTEDGRHMARPLGRYLAGLVWFGYLTGYDIDSVKFNPNEEKLNIKTVSAIKKSVKSALENPIK